ncbi:tetratricopeptide repeat protein [Sphingomonas sp.]|uniref:tetratricopeptide repeat protein n=1 Tax=Sphingomonas sp. TaxID=28214 RepID=UPI003D6C9EA2
MSHHWCARVAACLALLAPFPAIASEWWYVNSGPGRVLFVDARSIERRQDIVTYWTMHVIRPGEPEVMTKSRMRADCGKRKLGLLTMVRYDEQGRGIGQSVTRPGPMRTVPPDTLGDAEFRFACGDESHRVANDLFPLAMDEVTFAEALIARGNKPDEAHTLHEALTGQAALVADSVSPPAEAPASAGEETQPPPEEDVAELKQLEEACGAKDAVVCRRLGTRFAEGDGVAKDQFRAAALFDQACTMDEANGCTLLGIAYHNGDGVTRNAERAAALFAQACEKGGPADCGNIGLAYVKGEGVAKDVRRGVGYFKMACDKKNAAACSSLGAAHTLGIGTKINLKRARRLFEKACDGDDAGGCYNLGVVYDQGLGVTKDPVRAASLYVGACDRDDAAACGNLGSLTQNGSGVAKDVGQAGLLFAKSCDLGDADGCLNLGRAYQAGSGVTRDLARAADFFRRALVIEPDKADARRALAAVTPR